MGSSVLTSSSEVTVVGPHNCAVGADGVLSAKQCISSDDVG